MTKRRMFLLTVTAIALACLALAAWVWWTPALQYRLHHNQSREQRILLDYLAGRRPLEPSAVALAELWRRDMAIMQRLAVRDTSTEGGSLTAVAGPLPPGVTPSDPRVNELSDRALAIMIGPENWQHFQRMRAQIRDSS
jgi:hypothetical protein